MPLTNVDGIMEDYSSKNYMEVLEMNLTSKMTPKNMVYTVTRKCWRSPAYEKESEAIKAMIYHYNEHKRGKIEYIISKQYIYLLNGVEMLAFSFGANSPCKSTMYEKEDILRLSEMGA